MRYHQTFLAAFPAGNDQINNVQQTKQDQHIDNLEKSVIIEKDSFNFLPWQQKNFA